MNTRNIFALIMARGGSKGVPRKNIKPLNGRPLIAYTIDVARASQLVDRFAVSTEDEEIKAVSRSLGAEIIDRPQELAGDDVSNIPVWRHALQAMEERGYVPDILVQINPTAPLRTAADVDNVISLLLEGNCRAVFSSAEIGRPVEKIHSIAPNGRLTWQWPHRDTEMQLEERQHKPSYYSLNGSITALWARHVGTARTWKDVFLSDDQEGELKSYPMPAERSVDIDTPLDLKLAELLLQERENQ